MTTNRIHHFVAAGLVVTVGLAATSGAASAPADGEASAPPPVERVARETTSRGEECDRLRLRRGQGVRGHGGYPPSQGGSALSHRERDEDVHGHDRVPARGGGEASARQHAGRPPAGRRSEGRGDHDPAPARSSLGARERHGVPGMAQRGGTVALDQSDQQLALCGLQAAGVPARQPGALFEHELHRARSRDREGNGTLVRRGARAARPRSARSHADGAADDAPPP